MTMRPTRIALLLLASFPLRATAQVPARDYTQESAAARDSRMAWWRDAQFGLFIHWGLYAVPAGTYKGERVDGTGEWIMNQAHIPIPEYERYARAFNPVKFNADEWAR